MQTNLMDRQLQAEEHRQWDKLTNDAIREQCQHLEYKRHHEDSMVRLWCSSNGLATMPADGHPWWFEYSTVTGVLNKDSEWTIKSLWYDLFPLRLESKQFRPRSPESRQGIGAGLRVIHQTPWQFKWFGQAAIVPDPLHEPEHVQFARCPMSWGRNRRGDIVQTGGNHTLFPYLTLPSDGWNYECELCNFVIQPFRLRYTCVLCQYHICKGCYLDHQKHGSNLAVMLQSAPIWNHRLAHSLSLIHI